MVAAWPSVSFASSPAGIGAPASAASTAARKARTTWATYAFVPLGLIAIALAALGVIQPVSALHVLTVGVIATMMLAVMTRATRGHTGRPLTATKLTMASYLSLFAAALARPLADLTAWPHVMEASGALWILAFALFILEYGPMLILVRRKPRGEGA